MVEHQIHKAHQSKKAKRKYMNIQIVEKSIVMCQNDIKFLSKLIKIVLTCL